MDLAYILVRAVIATAVLARLSKQVIARERQVVKKEEILLTSQVFAVHLVNQKNEMHYIILASVAHWMDACRASYVQWWLSCQI